MTAAPLLKISVHTTVEAADAVSLALENIFIQPTATYTNERTKSCTVSVYCQKTGAWTPDRRRQLLAQLKTLRVAGLKLGSGKVSIKKLPRENWAEAWKKHFKPLHIGGALLVKPSWSKLKPRPGQIVITLDPGLSFGTGHHSTTGFCLRELVRGRRRGQSQSFLDIGTGSGILAIAAAKLGYTPIEAFDFDPESIRVARENAQLNTELKRLRLAQQDLTKLPLRAEKQFDLVCANLISNLLMAERERLVNRVKPGGTLVLAGILAKEFALVQKAFEKLGLKFLRGRCEKEWRSGTFAAKSF